jgi:hypothetical protein
VEVKAWGDVGEQIEFAAVGIGIFKGVIGWPPKTATLHGPAP